MTDNRSQPGPSPDDDADLVRNLRGHFQTLDGAEPATDFTASFARARELQLARAPVQRAPVLRWIAVAAAVVLAALLVPLAQRSSTPVPGVVPDTPVLLAELGRSTHWRAPSDRWLNSTTTLPDRGIPDLDHLTYEVKTWP